MDNRERISLVVVLLMLLTSCRQNMETPDSTAPPSALADSTQNAPEPPDAPVSSSQPAPQAEQQEQSTIFLQRDTDATDDGVAQLVDKMQAGGQPFYQTAETPNGLIASDDVIVLKINCQWSQRGGTNTDLIKAVAEALAAHPEGFTGEIVIADNGQGSGRFDWPQPNSAHQDQTVQDVVQALQGQMRISSYLWDSIALNPVAEYADGDTTDGYVVEDGLRETGLEISYPKFTTQYGTRISFKRGVWDEAGEHYNGARLKVINMPVLKSHSTYQVTGAVKSYMGVVANQLSGSRPHNNVGNGAMGTLMAETRMPTLNIIDMVWVGAGRGPDTTYDSAVSVRAIAARSSTFEMLGEASPPVTRCTG